MRSVVLSTLVIMGMVVAVPGVLASGDNWPGFRGENAGGVADSPAPPVTWNVTKSKNILWKTPITGLGHASPVIWGDRIFVLSAIGKTDQEASLKVGLYGNIAPVHENFEHQWLVICLDKNTGKVLWEKSVFKGVPKVKRHTKATHANSTPATDGRYVVSFFGSEGLFCHDMDGRLVWEKNLGVLDSGFFRVPEAQWGFGSSPLIEGDLVIIQCDVQRESFVAAFDIKTGKEIWRQSRKEVPTWGTPSVYTHDGKKRVVVNGYKHIGAYDLETGEPVWRLTGGGDIPVPTPIIDNGLIFITNAHGSMAPIYAIKTSAQGDITLEGDASSNEYIAWRHTQGGAYMQTPLVYDGLLYNCRDNGVLSVYKTDTGERLYQERLAAGQGGFTASAVAAAGKIYYTGEFGDIYVVKAGPEYELLATNDMEEVSMATPAISDGKIYFRTRGHLVAIGGK